jgi:hypothetical protein
MEFGGVMDIWVETRFKDFFAWQFSERELKLPERKQFIEQIKMKFVHNAEWMYFRADHKWLIHKSRFIDFMDLYCQFVSSYVNKQGEMYLG